ncbi:kinase-like domain-containing protein [Mycena sp. CBHHK59/15]|nr:kinase-like domain-containing protein [Mycena sp. CBHHK59/15]
MITTKESNCHWQLPSPYTLPGPPMPASGSPGEVASSSSQSPAAAVEMAPNSRPTGPTAAACIATPTKIEIYQSLVSYIKELASTTNTCRLGLTLDNYCVEMSTKDVVIGLVRSVEFRKTLLELLSDVGSGSDPRLRDALHKDETQIAAQVLSVIQSKTATESALQLEGDFAQYFLDVVQNTLDRGFLMDQKHSAKARRIIRKLSEACDKLPTSLFITGVTGREEQATFGGGFGDIYRASYKGKTVALKHMRTFHRGADLRRIRLHFCREALVWQHLNNPYILPLIGIDRESFPLSHCMVSPWMEHGTVLTYLDNHGRANVDKLLSEIAQGLQYLHSRNIVHGDLRGANILITHDWSACLADFGLAVLSDATTSKRTSNRAGSVRWMAPELIDPDYFGHHFARTPASDVYAFGCVCLELYTGRPPFSDLSEMAAMFRIIKEERPERPSGNPAITDTLWRLAQECWVENPARRPVTDVVVEMHMNKRKLVADCLSNSRVLNRPFSGVNWHWNLNHMFVSNDIGLVS